MSDLGLLVRFGEHMESVGLAPATRATREKVVLRFAHWLAKNTDLNLLDVETAHIEAWFATARSLASTTRTSYVGALRSFYEFAAADGAYLRPNPAGSLRRWPGVRVAETATVYELARGWQIDMERRGLARSTIEKRRSELRLLGYSFMDPRSPVEATTAELERYLDGRRLAAKARHTTIGHLRAFYAWAKREGLIDEDPAAQLVQPKLPRGVPRPIPTEHLAEALDQATPRVRAFLALAAFAGLRCQEIAGVARDDVLDHLDPPLLRVTMGKGARERLVPLHDEALSALRRLPMPRAGFVFADERGRPPKSWLVSQAMNSYLHNVVGTTSSAHTLRHWFASQLYARTRDLRMVQEMLGHASPTTTAWYAAFNPGLAVDAVGALSVR